MKKAQQVEAAFGDGGVTGVSAVARLAEVSAGRRGLNIATEYWINSILSGPKTLAVNLLSGVTMSVDRPLELMVGGGIQKALGQAGADKVIKDAIGEFTSLVSGLMDSARLGVAAGRAGEGILSPRTLVDVPRADQRAISAANVGLGTNAMAGKALETLGVDCAHPFELDDGHG